MLCILLKCNTLTPLVQEVCTSYSSRTIFIGSQPSQADLVRYTTLRLSELAYLWQFHFKIL
jgi:hypothetical protein